MTPKAITLFIWSGEWSWVPRRIECEHCWNLYWGPLGIELVHGRDWSDDD